MDNTPNLQLPYLIAAQAQKHVTHNEALRTLDAIVQLLVLDKDLATPPGSPADGNRYIVAASPTGAWTGQAGKIAAWQDGAWLFYAPNEGWLAWVADEDKLYISDGSAWVEFVNGLLEVVEDTSPQLGGDLDANGHNVGFDDGTGITDDAGNEQVLFHKTTSAVNQVGMANAAAGNAPQIAAEGGDANINLKLRGKGTGVVDADPLLVGTIVDDSKNEQVVFHKTASAVNQVGVTNAVAGNAPQIAAEGDDTNINLKLRGKGTGAVDADPLLVGTIVDDSKNEQVVFHKTASAVNQVGFTNAATGNAPQVAAEGDDTNISLKLRGKGTGYVDADKLGINATADTTNRLALKSAASLFDNVGNGHQHKINKAAAGDTASALFQTNYSGRAEFGLLGDDNFEVKVSPDGSSWTVAITVNRTTGAVSLGAGLDVNGNISNNAGALGLSAGGSNQNITLTPSGTGKTIISSIKNSIGDTPQLDTNWTSGVAIGASGNNKFLMGYTPTLFSGGAAMICGANSALSLFAPVVFGGTEIYFCYGGGNPAIHLNTSGNVGVGTGTGTISNKFSVEGIAAPQTDNAYTLGTSAKRWSEVYAATGTINTSDGRLKTGIADSPLGLQFIVGLRPVVYKWLEGGVHVEWVDEEYQEEEAVAEEVTLAEAVVEMVDGVPVQKQVTRIERRAVVDQVPVVDEAGMPVLVDGAPKMHPVPRMATVAKTRQVKREVARSGARTHHGLVAQEVKAALDESGVGDFAGWVLGDKDDPNSTQGLRYDQFIAPLIKAVQELAARVAALEARPTSS